MLEINPIPIDAPPLSPYLIVKDAAQAIEFYKQAFGAREMFRLTEPSGKLGHAQLAIGASRFMLADEDPDFGAFSSVSVGGSPVTLHLYVRDVDVALSTSIAAGAKLLVGAKDEFFGDRTGMISDPFGHKWRLASRKESLTPAQMQERWDALFK